MSVKNFVNYFVEESLRKKSLANLYDADINKACYNIYPKPVDITPIPFADNQSAITRKQLLNIYPSKQDLPKYLEKAEQLVEALHSINKQAIFEIRGNKKKITCGFYAEKDDLEIIESSILNYYPKSIPDTAEIKKNTGNFHVYDFLPNAPFYKALNSYNDFIISPLNMVPNLLLNIEENNIGVYQVIFTPLPGILHRMVADAQDCEWKAMSEADTHTTPSLLASAINKKIEYKSPDFKSYFSVCARIILPTEQLKNTVKAFISNYNYGSKAFTIIGNEKYTEKQRMKMFNNKVSYHTGFVLNSHELVSIMHIPFEILKNKDYEGIFEPAPVGDKPIIMSEYQDIIIGEWSCGTASKQIHLPIQREIPNVHIIGLPRTGKSTLLNSIAIEKFKKGESVFLLDHHGDLIETVKSNVPKDLIEKVVLIDFGLKNLTPQLSIRANVDVTNPSKASDDLSSSMRDVTTTRDKFWGPRMSYTFSCLYFIYSVLPDLNLADIRLLISSSKKAKNLRTKIKERIKHPIVIDFLEEIDATPFESMLPVISRLSQLLLDENSFRLFTLEQNKIEISDILNNGKLCLINLACGIIGKQRAAILSGLMDSLITNNAFARANIPFNERKPCTIIKDEFQMGPMDLDNQFTGIPKFNFSIVVAHQYLNQVEQRDRDVLATAGSKVIFKLAQNDAEVMARDLNDINPYEITSLKNFQAIVKIEDEVVKINTPKPTRNTSNYSEEITKNCIAKYYIKHTEHFKPKIKQKLLMDEI